MKPGILLIAAHYPPRCTSSGWQRTFSLAHHLADWGWQPVVLSQRPANSSETVKVVACPALDSRRLNIGGRYPRWITWPDPWLSWWPFAYWQGCKLIRRHNIQLIWSTYPIPTAHLIASHLQRRFGLPWVADFRDSMMDDSFPAHGTQRGLFRYLERRWIHQCQQAVFTTPSCLQLYRQRYRSTTLGHVISNGYDERFFTQPVVIDTYQTPITLLHSGLLDANDRNPESLLSALAKLRDQSKIIRLHFRGSANTIWLAQRIRHYQLQNQVTLLPSLNHDEAIAEIRKSHGLLLLQGDNCSHQIPAKIYEYFRSQRPILGLCAAQSDTGKLLHQHGLPISPIDQPDNIAHSLWAFVTAIAQNQGVVCEAYRAYDRQAINRHYHHLLQQQLPS